MMKKVAWCLLFAATIFGCDDEKCVSCVVQNIQDKTIIESRAACDKSSSYLSGFVDGIKSKYENKKDSVDIICN